MHQAQISNFFERRIERCFMMGLEVNHSKCNSRAFRPLVSSLVIERQLPQLRIGTHRYSLADVTLRLTRTHELTHGTIPPDFTVTKDAAC